jgi:hypothetical protein
MVRSSISVPRQRDGDLDPRAPARLAVQPEGAVEQRGALPHGPQANAPVAVGGVEAPAVVLHAAHYALRRDVEAHGERAAARVGHGVADGLAQHQEELAAHVARHIGLVAVHADAGADARRHGDVEEVPELRLQAVLRVHAPELGREVPRRLERRLDHLPGEVELGFGPPGVLFREDVVELEALVGDGHRVGDAVVELAADASPARPPRPRPPTPGRASGRAPPRPACAR